jgi:hypothetical protein
MSSLPGRTLSKSYSNACTESARHLADYEEFTNGLPKDVTKSWLDMVLKYEAEPQMPNPYVVTTSRTFLLYHLSFYLFILC